MFRSPDYDVDDTEKWILNLDPDTDMNVIMNYLKHVK